MVKGLIHDWCVLITAMIIYTFEMNFSFIYMNIFSTFYLTDHNKTDSKLSVRYAFQSFDCRQIHSVYPVLYAMILFLKGA